jgi:V8-like Glu-specific endopeptidase
MKLATLLFAGVAAATNPHSSSTSPRPEVGSLGYTSHAAVHNCSASIVASPKGNIIVTAAHCVAGKSAVYFTPAYDNGKAPHGTWRSTSIHVDPNWKTHHDIDHAGSPYDYAFVVLESKNGKTVAQVTGKSLKLDTSPTLPSKVEVLGYPSTSHVENHSYKDTPYRCESEASKNGASWEFLECVGIPGGFSGAPWIVGADTVIGVIGGKGQSLPDSNPDNYSVRFSSAVRELYNKAVAA